MKKLEQLSTEIKSKLEDHFEASDLKYTLYREVKGLRKFIEGNGLSEDFADVMYNFQLELFTFINNDLIMTGMLEKLEKLEESIDDLRDRVHNINCSLEETLD